MEGAAFEPSLGGWRWEQLEVEANSEEMRVEGGTSASVRMFRIREVRLLGDWRRQV